MVEDGGCGFLVERGDIEAMTHFTLMILKDEQLGRQLGARGRKLAGEKFSDQQMVSQYENYFRKILGPS